MLEGVSRSTFHSLVSRRRTRCRHRIRPAASPASWNWHGSSAPLPRRGLARKNGRPAVAAGLKQEEGDKAVALRDQLRVLNAQQIVTWGELNRTKNSPAAHAIHEAENQRIANEIVDFTEALSGGDVMYHIASLSVALENISGGVRVP